MSKRKSKTDLIERLKFFQTITHKISERKPLNKLLDEIIFSSKNLLNTEAASLVLYNKKDGLLHYHSVAGEKGSIIKAKSVRVGEGIAGWVAQNRKPLIIDNCYNDKRFNKEFDKKTGFKTLNMICVPMIKKKELVGVIQTMNKRKKKNFDKEDLDLFEALADQCAIAIENARLIDIEIESEQTKHELETAHKIQQCFLLAKLPNFHGLDVSIKLIPAKEVGGDYYYTVNLDDDKTLFFIADVSGKSVPAALIVSTLYSFFQFFVIQNKSDFQLKTLVELFNKFLVASTTPDKFVTAWFGLYSHSEKKLTSINAGHNPPFVLRNDSQIFEELSIGGLMLGSLDIPYTEETIHLSRGDIIVFYTDGIPEAMNKKSEELGENRFKKLIGDNRLASSEKISDEIIKAIEKFRGNAEQSDDITLGIIKF